MILTHQMLEWLVGLKKELKKDQKNYEAREKGIKSMKARKSKANKIEGVGSPMMTKIFPALIVKRVMKIGEQVVLRRHQNSWCMNLAISIRKIGDPLKDIHFFLCTRIAS